MTPHATPAIARHVSRLDELLSAKVWLIKDLIAIKPLESEVGGVYAITHVTDPSHLLYVGRTKTKTIHGRVCDHCSKGDSSDLHIMIRRWPNHHQVAKDYSVRWIQVDDPLERTRFEMFAIAVLEPLFNRI